MGKEKEKEKGGEREIKRERERGGSASALIAAAIGHAWRQGARERDARVEGKNRVLDTGVGTSFSGIGRSEQGGSRKAGVRVLRRDRAQRRETNLANDLTLVSFRDVTVTLGVTT